MLIAGKQRNAHDDPQRAVLLLDQRDLVGVERVGDEVERNAELSGDLLTSSRVGAVTSIQQLSSPVFETLEAGFGAAIG